MKSDSLIFLCLLLSGWLLGCKRAEEPRTTAKTTNEIKHASGLSIFAHDGFTIVKVNNPWPRANKVYTYILKEKDAIVPDSLAMFETVVVPVQKVIATSTTHLPSLELLGVEATLIGFPQLEYISSEKVRARIEAGKIRELGSNQSLNTEIVIDLNPDVIIGFGIDNNNPTLENLQKSGLKIVLDGDWNEQTPLGKAEWIKLFGVLYGKQQKADSIFSHIEKEYNGALALARKTAKKPTVLSGGMFENKWNLPRGESWGALFIKDAGGNYLWGDTKGSASLSLPFEAVLEKAQNAEFWIGPGQFSTLAEMLASNRHYGQFDAFKTGNVYSFKTGKTGGVIYFELAPNRPDLVLKDLVKILHPELLPGYELFFFQKLK